MRTKASTGVGSGRARALKMMKAQRLPTPRGPIRVMLPTSTVPCGESWISAGSGLDTVLGVSGTAEIEEVEW